MVSIEEEIVRELSRNSVSALATVVSRAGSAPRGVGAKMLLRADGSSAGTIGGGSVEAKVVREAAHVIETREPKTLHFELKAKDLAEEGAICGGDVTVFVEPLAPDSSDLLEIYRTIGAIRRKGGRSVLVTLVSADDPHSAEETAKALFGDKGLLVGSLPDDQDLIQRLRPEIDRVLGENRTEVLTVQRAGGEVRLLLEPVVSDTTLFIFGGGHISTCLAPLAKNVGFKVVVIDDRPDFANPDRFPQADRVLVDGFEGLLEKLEIDENSYLVLVTRGHLHDRVVLEQALRTDARYIGMIGSRRKIRMVYERVVKDGISPESLERVHAPIGLDIGAETPEEIAVSILAELIQVRAGK
ncbi:MAG: XdhC family protein [Deltaproteobacteria bacterium]|nr:XdhC family protein [Deltaproteobacteria bacterium]